MWFAMAVSSTTIVSSLGLAVAIRSYGTILFSQLSVSQQIAECLLREVWQTTCAEFESLKIAFSA